MAYMSLAAAEGELPGSAVTRHRHTLAAAHRPLAVFRLDEA